MQTRNERAAANRATTATDAAENECDTQAHSAEPEHAPHRPRRRSSPSRPHPPVGPHPSRTPSHPHAPLTAATGQRSANGLEGLDVFGDEGGGGAGDETAGAPASSAASAPTPGTPRAPRAKKTLGQATGVLPVVSLQPRAYETVELPAVDDETSRVNDAPIASSARTRRPATTARPITRRDTATVTRTTQMLAVVSQLDADPITLTPTRKTLAPSVDEARALVPVPDATTAVAAPSPQATRQVTVVPGSASANVPAIALPPKRKSHPMTVMTSWLLAITTVLAVIAAGGVLWATHHTPQQHVLPAGAPYALNPANQPPTGVWSASAGFSPYAEIGGGAGPGTKAPGSAGLPAKAASHKSTPAPSGQGAISPPPFYPWPPAYAFAAVPGYYAFRMYGPPGNYYYWAFGQCTWWAQYEKRGENLMHMGNARYWAANAAARGYRVGSRPAAGATVVFQPGVQGAGGAGHVAHVVKVYPDGWFLVSEMNFYWNGGGWARVDYRLAHAGWGVSFIY